MCSLGIDPGVSGALAFVDDAGGILGAYCMPVIVVAKGKGKRSELDMPEILRLLDQYSPTLAHVERAQVRPGESGTSGLTIGTNYGILLGILAGRQIRHSVVYSQTWQKEMFRGIAAVTGDPKQTALLACSRLWPAHDWRKSSACRKPHNGLVDAALMAEYGRRVFSGQEGK